jgi:hypothetical protein
MTYIPPSDVKSPKASWVLLDVIYNGGAGEHAVAVGEWDERRVLAMRWNGHGDNAIGNPQSRGIPTWFILPERYNEKVLEAFSAEDLPQQKRMIARALLGLGQE